MSIKPAAKAPSANQIPPAAKSVLQRKCACGNHTAAGGECTNCAAKKLQKKLSIGATNDPLESEADRVADQVLAYQPTHSFSNMSAPKIQRRAEQSSPQTEEVPASVEQVLAGSGSPLPITVRKDMEQRFGQDFSQVRMHTGNAAEQSAREVNANAYTVGNNIVFGNGKFSPETQSGKHLLAHELTHVQQQSHSNGIRLNHADKKHNVSTVSEARAGVVQRDPKTQDEMRKRLELIRIELTTGSGVRSPDATAKLMAEQRVLEIALDEVYIPPNILPPGRPTSKTLEQVRNTKGTPYERGEAGKIHQAEISGGNPREKETETLIGVRRHDVRDEPSSDGTIFRREVKNYKVFLTDKKGNRYENSVRVTQRIQEEALKDKMWVLEGKKIGEKRVITWDFLGAPPDALLKDLLHRCYCQFSYSPSVAQPRNSAATAAETTAIKPTANESLSASPDIVEEPRVRVSKDVVAASEGKIGSAGGPRIAEPPPRVRVADNLVITENHIGVLGAEEPNPDVINPPVAKKAMVASAPRTLPPPNTAGAPEAVKNVAPANASAQSLNNSPTLPKGAGSEKPPIQVEQPKRVRVAESPVPKPKTSQIEIHEPVSAVKLPQAAGQALENTAEIAATRSAATTVAKNLARALPQIIETAIFVAVDLALRWGLQKIMTASLENDLKRILQPNIENKLTELEPRIKELDRSEDIYLNIAYDYDFTQPMHDPVFEFMTGNPMPSYIQGSVRPKFALIGRGKSHTEEAFFKDVVVERYLALHTEKITRTAIFSVLMIPKTNPQDESRLIQEREENRKKEEKKAKEAVAHARQGLSNVPSATRPMLPHPSTPINSSPQIDASNILGRPDGAPGTDDASRTQNVSYIFKGTKAELLDEIAAIKHIRQSSGEWPKARLDAFQSKVNLWEKNLNYYIAYFEKRGWKTWPAYNDLAEIRDWLLNDGKNQLMRTW